MVTYFAESDATST